MDEFSHLTFNAVCLAPSLRAWLWFVLLGEALGISQVSEALQEYPSYETLIGTLRCWNATLASSGIETATSICRKAITSSPVSNISCDRFNMSLFTALQAKRRVSSISSVQEHFTKAINCHTLDHVPAGMLSIQIPIEFTCLNRQYSILARGKHPLPKESKLSLQSSRLHILLKEVSQLEPGISWVHSDARTQSALEPDVQNHAAQPPHEPRGYVAPEDDFTPRHTTSSCQCAMIEMPHCTAQILVENGDIPLLTYSPESREGWSAQILDTSPRFEDVVPPFVALSHVRSQGLGNSGRLALPQCQMALIQELANEAIESPHDPVPFYIDTMSVPLNLESKVQALKGLPWIFRHAAAVVVLDPCLMSATSSSIIDSLSRICYSSWIARLWTLQEGSLAQRLLFKFSNRMLDLDEFLTMLKPVVPVPVISRLLTASEDDSNTRLCIDRLNTFDRDVKNMKGKFMIIDNGVNMKPVLKSMVRLGYLGTPRFRYFCDEVEYTCSCIVLQALESVYQDPLLTASGELSQSRLHRMYSMVCMRTRQFYSARGEAQVHKAT